MALAAERFREAAVRSFFATRVDPEAASAREELARLCAEHNFTFPREDVALDLDDEAAASPKALMSGAHRAHKAGALVDTAALLKRALAFQPWNDALRELLDGLTGKYPDDPFVDDESAGDFVEATVEALHLKQV